MMLGLVLRMVYLIPTFYAPALYSSLHFPLLYLSLFSLSPLILFQQH